ncbi:MAG: hypothetical protein RLY71_317 [Pseudomonadota bacterium]|jgi:two-component system CheB/CheR fusion protein
MDDLASSVPMRVVGIGASAGGLEALELLFANIPHDTGMAFVVVQHLAPDFKSLMDELLRRHTTMPVRVAENGVPIEPNAVYLIPPKADMVVSGGRLLLSERDTSKGLNLPIDLFFRSLATEFGRRAVGVVLSGTGSDGSRGVVAIREAGGLVICQSLESAAFDGMPNSAIATGAVNVILAPSQIPTYLLNSEPGGSEVWYSRQTLSSDEASPEIYMPVFRLLSDHHGVDFKLYKLTTIARRIERRLRMRGCRGVDEYVTLLNKDVSEITALYHDLLIGVTEFYRDPEVWDRFSADVLPGLFDDLPHDQELRAWVAATATGEEAYTVAMLLHEAASRLGRLPLIRIFATDLHKASIEYAGQGVYPEAAVQPLGQERIRKYFLQREDGSYQIVPDIRRMVVFAQHNLLVDPPFTKLDLVSCRNLLIYLQPSTQRRVTSIFHFGLRRGGCLVLGTSESLGDLDSEFDAFDRRYKIYTKRRDGRLPVSLRETRSLGEQENHRLHALVPMSRLSSASGQQQLLRAYDTLLDTYVPPAFLVDSNGALLHTFGRAGDLLQTPSGRTTVDVTALILPELRMALTSGLQRAQRDALPASFGGIRVRLPTGDERVVRLRIQSLAKARRDEPVLVVIEDEKGPEAPVIDSGAIVPFVDEAPAVREHIEYLEAELRYAREHLQATVEELETTNEELQATNEELMASNEELQSSNEELHSVNEELYTVNKEYEDKIDELTQLSEDIENLLESSQIGTVYLDTQLRVRKFTPAVARQFNLLAQDVGRPIAHLSRNIEFDNFSETLLQVLHSGEPMQGDVRHQDGSWYLMRVHPYRHKSNAIGGLVVTFVDIQALKLASANLIRRNADLQGFAYSVSHDLREPVRMILSFSQLLEKKYSALPEANEKDNLYLEQIRSSSRRLTAMLDSILAYARVDSQGNQMAQVPLGRALEAAWARHEQAGRTKDAVLQADDNLPEVWADEAQLVGVFFELLQNAFKFRSATAPLIRVRAEARGNDLWRIEVSDNGIGIAADRCEVAFEMFKTLQERDAYPGLGAGLAIVRRTIERHGGQVHAEPGRAGGCTIWMTLHADARAFGRAAVAGISA